LFGAPARRAAQRPGQSIAFTKCRQHFDCQSFESAFQVGPFFAQYRLGI
jgi:hypothetical protein